MAQTILLYFSSSPAPLFPSQRVTFKASNKTQPMYLRRSAAFLALTSVSFGRGLCYESVSNNIIGKAQLEEVHSDTQCCLISRESSTCQKPVSHL